MGAATLTDGVRTAGSSDFHFAPPHLAFSACRTMKWAAGNEQKDTKPDISDPHRMEETCHPLGLSTHGHKLCVAHTAEFYVHMFWKARASNQGVTPGPSKEPLSALPAPGGSSHTHKSLQSLPLSSHSLLSPPHPISLCVIHLCRDSIPLSRNLLLTPCYGLSVKYIPTGSCVCILGSPASGTILEDCGIFRWPKPHWRK